MPFLTLLDPKARIRGSRDPLGFEALWSGLGRKVVGNLTTITNHYADFHATLLGYRFANSRQDPDLKVKDVLPGFLRIEQACAYARAMVRRKDEDPESIRGITVVRKRLAEFQDGGTVIRIGASTGHQILSDQQAYGLWGLFSNALRGCGLLELEGRLLSSEGRAWVDAELDLPPRVGRWFEELARRDGDLDMGKLGLQNLADLASALRRPCPQLDLRIGAGIHPPQTQMWNLLMELNRTELEGLDLSSTLTMGTWAASAGVAGHRDLASDLKAMVHLEAVLVAADRLLGVPVEGSMGQTLKGIEENLQNSGLFNTPGLAEHWLQALDGASRALESMPWKQPYLDALGTFASQASLGNFASALETLVGINAMVMARRHGAPWFRIDEEGTVEVLYRYEPPGLPEDPQAMETMWANPYFLPSLVALARQFGHGMGHA